MTARPVVLLVVGCVALAAAGCSRGNRPTSAREAATRPVPPPSGSLEPALSARAYFDEATAIDLFAIRAAEIALERGSVSSQSLAVHSKRQHEAIASQFSLAGRRLDMLPSPVLPPHYQQELAELRSASSFDRIYAAQQQFLLSRAIRLHSRYATNGSSPTLRQVARFAASSLRSTQRLVAAP